MGDEPRNESWFELRCSRCEFRCPGRTYTIGTSLGHCLACGAPLRALLVRGGDNR